jgi:hypothetical protein
VAIGPGEFVVERIFAADEWGVPCDRQIMATECGAHQGTERLGAVGVAPAEVIEDRDPVGVGSHGNRIAHRFVDSASGHVVGIVITQTWIHATADHQATPAFQSRADDCRIAGAIPMDTDQWLDDAAPLNLVVVLPNDPVLASDVGGSEDLDQGRFAVELAGLGEV